MRLAGTAAAIVLGLAAGISARGQSAPAGLPPAAPTSAAPASTAATSMGVLQPAVISLQQAVDILRAEKWKASRELKAATADNIASIRRDVEVTLPGLVTSSDASPASLAAMLPLTRNVGALYDVVLRVTVIAESSAPGDQAGALGKALSGLETARRTLSDREQQMAATEATRVVDLQRQLNARPAVAAVCPPVLAPVPSRNSSTSETRHRKRKKPAAAKPAGTN